jgi:RsiW-degrading membrane proteinase PrsW (M82 family)
MWLLYTSHVIYKAIVYYQIGVYVLNKTNEI